MKKGFTSKHCPKCNCNVFIDQDGYVGSEEDCKGWYEWCIQCGYTHYLNPTSVSIEEFEETPTTKEPAIA